MLAPVAYCRPSEVGGVGGWFLALVFGSGVAALADPGLAIWAIVLAVAATVHLALTFPLRQRPQRGT